MFKVSKMRQLGLVLACGLTVAAMGAHPAGATVVIAIDKAAQQMSVTVDGAPRWQWRVSTGRHGHETPSGTFRASRMDANHRSKEWDDAPMPHSIFFTELGHAIHGTYDSRHIGSAASHGCVRLSTANAAKLFALVAREGARNTTVVVARNATALAAAQQRVLAARVPAVRTDAAGTVAAVPQVPVALEFGAPAAGSIEDPYAPFTVFRQPDIEGSQALPFAAASPFPAPGQPFGGWR
jgi:L,D-transpeptidase-like protein